MQIEYVPDDDAILTSVGVRSLNLLAPGTLKAYGHPREGLTTSISVKFDGVTLAISAVKIEGEHPAEVTTEDLRSVRVVELVQQSMPRYVEGLSIRWSYPVSDDFAQAVREGWPAPPAMVSFAETYNFARALRLPPIKAVMDNYGVSRATAHRWVNQCREAGMVSDG